MFLKKRNLHSTFSNKTGKVSFRRKFLQHENATLKEVFLFLFEPVKTLMNV